MLTYRHSLVSLEYSIPVDSDRRQPIVRRTFPPDRFRGPLLGHDRPKQSGLRCCLRLSLSRVEMEHEF